MRKITRKIVTAAVATALVIPGVSGIATAQSSFGSSSSDSGAPSTGGSKSVKFERAIEQLFIDSGQIISPTAEKHAEALLKRALNHEIPFIDNTYETSDTNPLTISAVIRVTPEEFDYALYELDNGLQPDMGEYSGLSVPFGIAVGKDSDFYYIALSFIAG